MTKLDKLAKKGYSADKKHKVLFIDIDLDMYTDLYNEWDFSPQKKRDMDEDLFNYIVSCSTEIPLRKKVIIRMHLPSEIKDEQKERNAIAGISRYLSYCLEKNSYLRNKAYKSMFLYGVVGFGFLSLGIYIPILLKNITLFHLLEEGMFIGGWVLFWEAFSIIFFKDAFYRDQRKHLQRLIKTSIEFHYHKDKKSR